MCKSATPASTEMMITEDASFRWLLEGELFRSSGFPCSRRGARSPCVMTPATPPHLPFPCVARPWQFASLLPWLPLLIRLGAPSLPSHPLAPQHLSSPAAAPAAPSSRQSPPLRLLFVFFLGLADFAVVGMAAAASMASLASTSCLPQRLSASRARHQASSRVELGFRASVGVANCQRLGDSSFSGVQVQLRTAAGVRKQSLGAPIRAAGAKGDYLVQKVSARELDDILANERSSPMVVDFYATWCGPCILLAQELEQLAVEYGDRVRFLKIDTDEEHELANQMEIRGLPTMVFVSPDTEKLAIRTEGLLSTNVIRDIIEKEL